ncbi:MAG: PspC domain-containing protein [Bacteroidales bacterium]|nr:PspC domain-containing protein [Bacteroidales bacterium]
MVFNIDDDACQRLSQYLSDIEKHFPEADRAEILRDIEVRMAELLSFKLQGRNVVEINDIEEVIEVIGKPEQFDDEDVNSDNPKNSDNNVGGNNSQASSEGATTTAPKSKRPRKLYRNSNDRMIGGVASGVAAYFDIDPAVVRILFIVLTFISFGWGILIYLILLIAMPEAKTKAQFLEMQGVEPTLENINNFHQESMNRTNKDNTFGKIVKICLIILGIFVGISLAVAVLGIFIAMFAAALTGASTGFGDALDMCLLGSCALFLLCPVIGIAVLCTRAFTGERKHKWVGWTLLAVWILSLFGIIGFGIQESKRSQLGERVERSFDQWERWCDGWDDIEYYNNTFDLDSVIDPVIEGVREEGSSYDISIQKSPERGVNIRIDNSRQHTDRSSVDTTENNPT